MVAQAIAEHVQFGPEHAKFAVKLLLPAGVKLANARERGQREV